MGGGSSKNLLSTSDINNSLTSTSTTQPLSANQGKVLNDKIESRTSGYKILGATVTLTYQNANYLAYNLTLPVAKK